MTPSEIDSTLSHIRRLYPYTAKKLTPEKWSVLSTRMNRLDITGDQAMAVADQHAAENEYFELPKFLKALQVCVQDRPAGCSPAVKDETWETKTRRILAARGVYVPPDLSPLGVVQESIRDHIKCCMRMYGFLPKWSLDDHKFNLIETGGLGANDAEAMAYDMLSPYPTCAGPEAPTPAQVMGRKWLGRRDELKAKLKRDAEQAEAESQAIVAGRNGSTQ